MTAIKIHPEYSRGFHEGYIEGQAKSLKSMQNVMEACMNPKPMLLSKEQGEAFPLIRGFDLDLL